MGRLWYLSNSERLVIKKKKTPIDLKTIFMKFVLKFYVF